VIEGDENEMDEYDGTSEHIHMPNLKMEGCENTFSSSLPSNHFSEVAGFNGVKFTPMKEMPELQHVATSFENNTDPYPITSLQELEQFTLPFAAYSPTTESVIYATFHPTSQTESSSLRLFAYFRHSNM